MLMKKDFILNIKTGKTSGYIPDMRRYTFYSITGESKTLVNDHPKFDEELNKELEKDSHCAYTVERDSLNDIGDKNTERSYFVKDKSGKLMSYDGSFTTAYLKSTEWKWKKTTRKCFDAYLKYFAAPNSTKFRKNSQLKISETYLNGEEL